MFIQQKPINACLTYRVFGLLNLCIHVLLIQTDDEDESFVLEDPTLLNIDTIDSHSYDTSSVASSDSGDRTNLKR